MAQISVRISSRRRDVSGPRRKVRDRSNLISVSQRIHANVNRPSINSNQFSESFQKSKIKIGHLNIRSLKKRDHIIQLRCLVKENGYDIFAVSESWLNSTVSNAEVEIEGYKLSRLDRSGRVGGGVCVYTRTSLKVKILEGLTEISPSGFHQLWLHVQHRNLKSILLCTIYRPPDCSITCFVDEFLEKHTLALSHGKEVFIIGDINCDISKYSWETRALTDLCSSLNLTQLITSPTRVTPQSSSVIDVIMTTNTALVAESGVIENHISDHYLIFTRLKLKISKPPPTFINVRCYNQYDRNTFLEDMAQQQWEDIFSAHDVDTQLNKFNRNFLRVIDRHAPVKTVKVRYRHSPFVDDEIRILMRKRDQLHRFARQTRNACDWDSFRVARNEVKKTLREAEKIYVQNEIYNNKEPNAMWKVIRRCMPRKEASQPVYTRDLKELADEFNIFYTSVGDKVSEESKKIAIANNLPLMQPEDLLSNNVTDKFHFHPVSAYEISKIVDALPSNKAPGMDKISVALIKDALPVILPILTEIVNRSLSTSVFPLAWKKSEVIPILKEGDYEIANDNRPVSLLPVASKICERVALNQLMAYMSQKRCLTVHQSGNKKLHSTETLNILVTDMILEAMDKKELTAVVLLDLSKAFDTIDHLLLLKKLNSIGVSKKAVEWFKSYLSDRMQCVRIGHILSEACVVTHGVPQGSILGPVLFNIYINDLSTIPITCPLESFVDDSKIYLSFSYKDIDAAQVHLTNDLRRISTWCCSNSLLVNPEKTKLLLLGTAQMLNQVMDFRVIFLGKELRPVSSARDLGMQLDQNLNYDEHIIQTVSKCTKSLCQINRVKHVLDSRTLVVIINALVFSKLYYCSSVWANTSQKNIAKLQSVQNFAARIATGLRKNDHITPALQKLKWLPVSYMLRYRDTLMAFKCLKDLAPPYLARRFTLRSQKHDRVTRQMNELDMPFYRTAAGQRSFLYRASQLWNGLDNDIKNSSSITIFKKQIRKRLYTECWNGSE